MPSVSARTIASIPALFVGLVVLVALAAIDLIVALVAAVALAGLTLVLVQRTATNRVLSALNAAQLEEGVESRLESLVESICASHGINEPGLYVAKTTAMDAAVVGRSDDTRLVVTQGLLDRLDRLELESVVARQLSMFGSGVFAGTVLASVGGLLGPLGGSAPCTVARRPSVCDCRLRCGGCDPLPAGTRLCLFEGARERPSDPSGSV